MHHANLLVGGKTWAFSKLPLNLRTPSADVLIYDGGQLSVAEVRKIIYEASLRPLEGDYRTFIIASGKILLEAQNALLKLIEEPGAAALFYLITPKEDLLLPTLRSRLFLLDTEEEREETEAFAHFLKASPGERLKCIAEKMGEEDSAWVDSIIEGIESYAHTKRDGALMREVLKTASYLRSTGSSKKMLLEHLALCL